ncbi:hypothetical protein [uncultured Nocardioides sp.]|uniref:hypothetical protein n=1 Tax=uncultured Nocardioides sp. TaxID=198441 RepID=UPI0025FBF3C4|nr:hypothetical protein [uncultured Nocardioides sp.]
MKVSPAKIRADRTRAAVAIRVAADGVTPAGEVVVDPRGKARATGELRGGRVAVRLPAFGTPGRNKVAITYLGSRGVERERVVQRITVARR